eukprot:409715-Amphidinium_carterae.1
MCAMRIQAVAEYSSDRAGLQNELSAVLDFLQHAQHSAIFQQHWFCHRLVVIHPPTVEFMADRRELQSCKIALATFVQSSLIESCIFELLQSADTVGKLKLLLVREGAARNADPKRALRKSSSRAESSDCRTTSVHPIDWLCVLNSPHGGPLDCRSASAAVQQKLRA